MECRSAGIPGEIPKRKVNDVGYMQNKIKGYWNAVTSVLVGIAVLLAALFWGFRIFGFKVFIVQSGSMEPNYRVGALVYVRPVDPEKLEAGDVITFELGGGARGTHRIVEVLEENGTRTFLTKGDNNDQPDAAPVSPERIVGEVKFTVPYLGFLAAYIQQPPGTYVAVSVVAVLLLLVLLPDLIFPEGKEKKEVP